MICENKLFMYTIYDRAANMYTAPAVTQNEACARREFKKIMSETKFEPTDFELCRVGWYDPHKCIIDYDFEKLENGGHLEFINDKEVLDIGS